MKDKKILILESLEHIIKSKRFHEVKIDDIAKKCKIGKGTIYTYFKSKDEMYYELAMYGMDVMIADIGSIEIRNKDIEKLIYFVANKLNRFFETRQALMRVLQELCNRTSIMTKERKKRMLDSRAKLRNSLSRVIDIGIAEGLIIDSYSSDQLSELLVHTLIGRSHWEKDVIKIPVEELTKLTLFKTR